jgi:chromosome segregation ATPase
MLFKSSKPVKIGAILKELQDDRESLLKRLEEAKDEMGAASLGKRQKLSGAREAFTAKQSKVRELKEEIEVLDAEIESCKRTYSKALEDERKASIKLQWKKTEELANKRHQLAREIDKEASALAEKLQKLTALGEQIYVSAPKKEVALNVSALSSEFTIKAFKLHMLKHGCSWIDSWTYGIDKMPEFMDRISEGNRWIMKMKDQSQ